MSPLTGLTAMYSGHCHANTSNDRQRELRIYNKIKISIILFIIRIVQSYNGRKTSNKALLLIVLLFGNQCHLLSHKNSRSLLFILCKTMLLIDEFVCNGHSFGKYVLLNSYLLWHCFYPFSSCCDLCIMCAIIVYICQAVSLFYLFRTLLTGVNKDHIYNVLLVKTS